MGDFFEDNTPKKLHSGVWYNLLFSSVKIHKNWFANKETAFCDRYGW